MVFKANLDYLVILAKTVFLDTPVIRELVDTQVYLDIAATQAKMVSKVNLDIVDTQALADSVARLDLAASVVILDSPVSQVPLAWDLPLLRLMHQLLR